MIYLAQVCQMFAYALFVPASVYYVNEKIAVADRVKGQSLVTTSMTLSGVFANFAGGIMLDALGVGHVLLAGVSLIDCRCCYCYFNDRKSLSDSILSRFFYELISFFFI